MASDWQQLTLNEDKHVDSEMEIIPLFSCLSSKNFE